MPSPVRPFTSRTRVALAIARAIAAARGDRDLTPTHVAVGIFREGGNAALAALYHSGFSQDVLHKLGTRLEHQLGTYEGNRAAPRQVALDATEGEATIIRLGEVEADRLNDAYLGAEHLLLAILRDTKNEAAVLLATCGVSLQLYEDGLRFVRRGERPNSAEPG